MKRIILTSAMLLLAACGSPSGGTAGASATTAASPAAPTAPAAEPTPAAETVPVAAASPAADEQLHDGLTEMVGTWKVAAVRVKPSDVQALTENDPTDMGAVLDISRDRLSWRPREEGTFSDACTGPKLTLDGQVSCKEGEFGPPGAQLVAKGDRLQLDWYDGATLELRRER